MKYNNRLNKDLGFSNTIHKKLVEPLFQKKFGINLIQANIDWDRNDSIDYIGLKNNKKYSFQERIRRFSNYTKNSFEFTLRYERNNSLSENQKKSEFFKINAQFLFYSILNEDLNDFNRYCIINIKNLMKCLDKGLIKIDYNKNNNKNKAYLHNDTPVCIIKNNHEKTASNSSFIIFNVQHIQEKIDSKLEKKDKIISNENGYKKIINNKKKLKP